MKKLFIILGLSFLLPTLLLAQGIQFLDQPSSWDEVLAESKKTQKPIFVDVYTEWCGPCKWMDQHVFNQDEVGGYMNGEFLSVKLDAEKGYGLEFVNKYKIGSFPTYMYFSPLGELVLMAKATKPSEGFIAQSKKALQHIKEGLTYTSVAERVQNAKEDPTILKKALDDINRLGVENGVALEMYLTLLPEDSLKTPATINFLLNNYSGPIDLTSTAFQLYTYAYRQKPLHDNIITPGWLFLKEFIRDYVDTLATHRDEQGLEELMLYLEANFPESMAPIHQYRYRSQYYAETKDLTKFENNLKEFAQCYFDLKTPFDLQAYDQSEFKRYIQIKYGLDDQTQLSTEELNRTLRSYMNFPRFLMDEYVKMLSHFKLNFPEDFAQRKKGDLQKWLDQSIKLYQENPIFVNTTIIDHYRKMVE